MFTATLFFLGLSFCMVTGLVCYWLANNSKEIRNVNISAEEHAAWNNIKTALIGLYSRYENKETPRQKALRSWAGTMVICAGICMIGVLLETEYNQNVSTDSVIAGFVFQPKLPVQDTLKHKQYTESLRPVSHQTKTTNHPANTTNTKKNTPTDNNKNTKNSNNKYQNNQKPANTNNQ